MKEFISHRSAAYLWNIPHVDRVLDARYRDESITNITVDNPAMVYAKKGYIVHATKIPLPRGAIRRRGKDLVASPELVFLQLANELDIHRLILLGLQMCSHSVGRTHEAITTKQRLQTFLENSPKHHGQKKARTALKFIEDDSASLMESLVFMILTLPHSFGGYGLSGACFNYEIPLNNKAKHQLDQERCFVDLYYRKENLALEYDSFKHHSSPSAQRKDQLRASALKSKGVEVVHLTTAQLYNDDACRKLAFHLASQLGRRIRIRAKGFCSAHNALRGLLPSR